MPPVKRILIVSASAGAGHVRAADALLKEFQSHPALQNGGHVEHWDLLNYTTKLFRHLYAKTYLSLVNKTPALFGFLYSQTNSPWKNEKARLAFEKTNAKPFIQALQQYQPDLVVTTHFTPGFLLSDLFAEGAITHKPAIVITDLDVHATWLAHHYQHYFVSIPESKIYLQRLGIDPAKITISGIPIDPIFRTPKDQTAMRAQFNLDPNRFTILVSAGGFGVGPIDQLIEELLSLKVPAQVIAIAGKSEALKARLDARAAAQTPADPVRLIPVGFTKQMDEYMAAADILISKPGGLTTSEAMARGLPMCITNPIPGQEERNADHLLEAGVAIRANNLSTIAWKIQQLIENPARLTHMRQQALAFAHPLAAQTIANTLLT